METEKITHEDLSCILNEFLQTRKESLELSNKLSKLQAKLYSAMRQLQVEIIILDNGDQAAEAIVNHHGQIDKKSAKIFRTSENSSKITNES